MKRLAARVANAVLVANPWAWLAVVSAALVALGVLFATGVLTLADIPARLVP